MGVWAYMRHYLNLHFLWSVLTSFRTVGPFELNWETQQYKCWISQPITFTLLAALQLLNLFWFGFIVRIAYRAVSSNEAKDDRSDDDGTEAEEETKKTSPKSVSNGHIQERNPSTAIDSSGLEATPHMNGTVRTTRSKMKENAKVTAS